MVTAEPVRSAATAVPLTSRPTPRTASNLLNLREILLLLRDFDRATLADHSHLDLARIFELILDLARDLVRQQNGTVVVHLGRLDHYANLAARLKRIGLLHAGLLHRDVLESREALDVALEALAARARTRGRDRVGGDQENGLDGLRLHLVVMRLDGVEDTLRLAVPARQLGGDRCVRAFDLVRHRLAEVVHERSPLGGLHARLELGGHDPRQVHDLERVLEDVLAVARPVLQAAQDLDEILVHLPAVRLEHGLLAGRHDVLLELRLGLVVHLLDSRRMDPAVLDQLRQCDPRHLAPDAVEGGQDDGLRRVVDDDLDARQAFEGADVPALLADDAALHVVGGKLDDGDGGLGRVARGHALERVGDEIARAPLRLDARLFLLLPDLAGELMADQLLGSAQQVPLRLFDRHAGDV